jgi:hypothetical protein
MAYASLEEIKAANMSSTKLDNSLGGTIMYHTDSKES